MAIAVVPSQSCDSLRLLPAHARVRSSTQRPGSREALCAEVAKLRVSRRGRERRGREPVVLAIAVGEGPRDAPRGPAGDTRGDTRPDSIVNLRGYKASPTGFEDGTASAASRGLARLGAANPQPVPVRDDPASDPGAVSGVVEALDCHRVTAVVSEALTALRDLDGKRVAALLQGLLDELGEGR